MYITTLAVYIYTTYLIGQFGEKTSIFYPILMCFGLIYPFIYDTTQLIKGGWGYFDDPFNWSDFCFQWAGVTNVVFVFTMEPSSIQCTVSMSIVLILGAVKSMTFLRIFDTFAYIIALIKGVTYGMRIFLLFYVIMLFLFSLILGTVGW
jgi:hypothetical protein